MSINISSLNHFLSTPTSFFGLKLWITITIIFIGLLLTILLIILLIFFYTRRRKNLYNSNEKKYLSRPECDIQRGFSSRKDSVVYSGRSSWLGSGSGMHVVDMQGGAGRCKSFSAREVHLATDGFSQGYMISSGDHGEVYRGILLDGERVIVNKFISRRCRFNYDFNAFRAYLGLSFKILTAF
ncbi:putative serine/threonine-protein kinase At1g01540 [Bidens hawaiensis]|uniref:putative serine/threonine-protein kinase At1g01540 n=1 Tax=Bidens hawaiensis TaxID=980011 RepID=UPI004049FD15